MKKVIALVIVITLLSLIKSPVVAKENDGFSDVPVGHWAKSDINDLRRLKVTDGIGDNLFGYGETLTRSQFIGFLGKLNQWSLISPELPSYDDNTDPTKWYYSYIETALSKGIINKSKSYFRPSDLITREEMSLMIIKSLGYDWLAIRRGSITSPFEDVTTHVGYIAMLKDFGIINGKTINTFDPNGHATREEAAAILMRMYNRTHAEIDESNAFYAIKSYHQKDLIQNFDSISYDWADISYDESGHIYLEMDYPPSYELALEEAKVYGKKTYLSIYGYNSNNSDDQIVSDLVREKYTQNNFSESILSELQNNAGFDGVVIDFENIKDDYTRNEFVNFLQALSLKLHSIDKKLIVMVQPDINYNYDYKSISKLADQMILMAHDYNAKYITEDERINGITTTPVAPLGSIYEALKALCDEVEREDMRKVSLQVSFSSAQWKVDQNGYVTQAKPYTPLYEDIYPRLLDANTKLHFGATSKNPFATFYDESTKEDNIIWYEDRRSVEAKLDLAKMFGINDVSIWRLGNIPNYAENDEKNVFLDIMPLFE